VIGNYPSPVQKKLLALRALIIQTAEEIGITQLDETLKRGEPSYLTKMGNTIRFDLKKKSPDRYAMYFKCTSRLVPTFRTIYGDVFEFEGDRAIVFRMGEKVPVRALKQCVKSTLTYHKVKHLPTLGI
jgi:hypothetical protein